jgi:hypothetical protein
VEHGDNLKVLEKSEISCTAGSLIRRSLYRLRWLYSYDDDNDDDDDDDAFSSVVRQMPG